MDNDMKNKLEIKNNWESYEYYVNGERVQPESISHVYNEFGDGFSVSVKNETASYSDHGHRSTVTRKILVHDTSIGDVVLRPNKGADIFV